MAPAMLRRGPSIVLLAAVAAAPACSGGAVELDKDGDQTIDNPNTDCSGAETFVAGISHETPLGRTVKIASAAPTPPDVGDNAWTIEVLDASGAAAEGLGIEVEPWMPLHGHGLVPPDYGSIEVGGGTYEMEPFDLIMPGLWQFTVDVGLADGEPDAAVFLFCAEG